MRNFLIFNGKKSSDFGVWISGEGVFNAPERDITTVSVPGRNGDLIYDNGRFNNIPIQYPAFIHKNFIYKVDQLKFWLKSSIGYQRLEDSYNPDYFRMAYYQNNIDFTPRFLNWGAEFTLYFICKPQRFLKSGEYPISILNSGEQLFNPYMDSLPLIKVNGNGSGSITINTTTVTINSMTDYLYLDCDLQNAYKGTINQNNNIVAPVFPILSNGSNIIGWSGGVENVEITPRWWTL